MNKILINSDGIIIDDDSIVVDGDNIKFNKDGIYSLEYENIDNIELCIEINNNASVVLFESSFLDNIVVNNRYVINDGALRINKFYNNKGVVENIDIELCSINSKIDYRFSNICSGLEKYTINIRHNNKNTVSSINNKSIAMDGSKLDFVINSIVMKEYDGSILDQNTRIVTIGDSESKISPNMFIDCDDAVARHGSVVGTFKDELIFYLMSRGIEYNEAIKLLVKGFLFSNMDVNNKMRERILSVIDMYWR